MNQCFASLFVCLLLVISWDLHASDTPVLRGSEVPFEMHNGFIVVELILEKKLPLKFIFDTGAEHSLITKKQLIDILDLRYVKKFKVLGADLSKEMYAMSLQKVHLTMNQYDISDQRLLVLDEDYFQIEDYIGMQIHGILGMHYFRNCSVKINYRKRVLTFTPTEKFKEPSKKYTSIPITVKKHKPYVETSVQLNDTASLALTFLIDTGASLSLLVHNNTHTDLKLPENIIKGNLGMGLGGMLEGYVGRMNRLAIGPFEFQNMIVNYMEISEHQSNNKSIAYHGIIGNVLLSRFDIIIDYPNKILYLKPTKKYNREFSFDKSGITAIAAGSNLRQYFIQNVIKDSPADLVGLQTGDEILKINFRHRAFLSLDRIQSILNKSEGKTIKLVFKRDGKKVKTEFKLRKLL